MKLSKANSWYGLFFIIAFTWGLIGFSRPILLEKLERPSYDWRLFQSSTQSTHSDIVLVRAGEESLNQFGVWPWPRRFHAQLLGQLNQAKTIVLDILFPEQSVPEDDLVLANAIKSHGNVILAMHIAPQYQGRQDRLIPPIAKLVQASAGAGVTNIETDIDGLIRFFHPARPVGNLMVPSLSLATLAAVTQQKPELALNANQRYVLTLGTKHFLSDAQGRIWLPHPMTKIPVYEYSQVMNGQVAPEVFANKIVMVGIAASGSADFYARPAPGGSRVVSGVQVNAEILETLLNGFIPQRVSATIEGIAAFMLAVAGILLALYGRPLRSILGFVFVCTLFSIFNLYLFFASLQWLMLVTPNIAAFLSFFSALFVRYKFLHADWEIKTISISSIFALNGKANGDYATFFDYLHSIWPEVKKSTSLSLLATCSHIQELMKISPNIQIEAKKYPGHDIILIENKKATPCHQILIPIFTNQTKDSPEYILVGRDKKITGELIKAISTLILSSFWFFCLLKETGKRKQLLLDTIHAIFTALDVKDPITGGHSIRVAEITKEIIGELNLDHSTCEDIYLGALIHDVGKIGIPDSVLNSSHELNQIEFGILRNHLKIAEKIMNHVDLPENTYKAIAEHHERFDGSGYPHCKGGDQISLAGRILAVADVFDALCSERPYRKAATMDDVCQYLLDNAGTKFDPEIVDIIIRLKASEEFKRGNTQLKVANL